MLLLDYLVGHPSDFEMQVQYVIVLISQPGESALGSSFASQPAEFLGASF